MTQSIPKLHPSRHTKRKPKLSAILIGTAAFVLTSCGSSATASASSTTSTTAASSVSQAAYRACLSSHGYSFPKYNPGSKVPPTTVPASVRQAAVAQCASSKPKRKTSGAKRTAILAYTSCLSQHGVAIPTTTTSATSPSKHARGGLANLRSLRSSPQFATASKACASLKPSFSKGSRLKGSTTTSTTTAAG